MQLTSSVFANNAPIPQRYSAEGDNISPPLVWRDAPEGTKSFALICYDPDAPNGTFRHWAAYDIGRERDQLPEAFPTDGGRDGIKQAVNDFEKHGYGGPLPPEGHGPHHYHFRLLALDTEHLDVRPEASVQDVEKAAAPHKLGEAELVGIYERKKQ